MSSESAVTLAMATIKDKHSKLGVEFRGDYQTDGVMWMLNREHAQGTPRGGIVADDMGLGKTFMSAAVCIGNPKKTLIIVPSSLRDQWAEALRRFGGINPFSILKANFVGGLNKEKDDMLVVICAYDTARNPDVKRALTSMVWGRVILDEGHQIKNKSTQSYKMVSGLQTDIRWVLTGTPIQNDVKELKSILNWVGVSVTNSTDSIQEACRTFFMRRTQETIGQEVENLRLPGLEQRFVHIPFKYEEEKKANAYVENNHEKIINRSRKADKNREAMTGILRCRQLCTHLFILINSLLGGKSRKRKADSDSDSDSDIGDDDSDLVMKPITNYDRINHKHLERIDPDLAEIFSNTSQLRSTKLEYLCNAIKGHPNEKALVFCTWREEMNIIAKMLAGLGITCLQFHGSLDSTTKSGVIQNFNSPAVKVLLVQIDCGGTGLNLQQASRVYITSASWNPCQDLQAICRSYRTGQSRPVICTRLCIKDTIEERVLQLQLQKLETISSYLNDKSFSDRLMGNNNTLKAEDIKYIFSSVRKAREEAELARGLAQAGGQGQKKRPSSLEALQAAKRRCGKSSAVSYEELQSRAQRIIASLPAMSYTPDGMMVLDK